LNGIGPDVLRADVSGYALVMLVEFLRERFDEDISAFEAHPLAEFLSRERSSYFAAIVADRAIGLVEKLDALGATESELRTFANEFSESDDPDAGAAMLAVQRSLRDALPRIRPGTLGLLHVG
jgi:hypothetical protein